MAMYFDMFLLLLMPPTIFVMRQMARRDEMIFRLLGLRWKFKFKARNRNRHPGIWVFTPNAYRLKPGAVVAATAGKPSAKRTAKR